MTRWARGEADVEQLIASGALQQVTPSDGTPWIERARTTLATAHAVVGTDPASAFTLAYEAVRHACTGLLVHQGLRPTTTGGHVAVERAVRAQLGPGFAPYGALRRRRHELEYPTFADDVPDPEELADALESAAALVGAAAAVLPSLGVF